MDGFAWDWLGKVFHCVTLLIVKESSWNLQDLYMIRKGYTHIKLKVLTHWKGHAEMTFQKRIKDFDYEDTMGTIRLLWVENYAQFYCQGVILKFSGFVVYINRYDLTEA